MVQWSLTSAKVLVALKDAHSTVKFGPISTSVNEEGTQFIYARDIHMAFDIQTIGENKCEEIPQEIWHNYDMVVCDGNGEDKVIDLFQYINYWIHNNDFQVLWTDSSEPKQPKGEELEFFSINHTVRLMKRKAYAYVELPIAKEILLSKSIGTITSIESGGDFPKIYVEFDSHKREELCFTPFEIVHDFKEEKTFERKLLIESTRFLLKNTIKVLLKNTIS